MHVQIPTPGWLDAAMLLPDYSVVKSVHNGSTLREVKLKWISLNRDPKKLTTLYRHAGLEPSPVGSTWEQAVAWWKVNFAKFVDGTWLTQYAPYVDLVEDCNEYCAVSTWVDDPDHGASKLSSMEAAAWVWNNFYRGKQVTSSDGGHGFIPATCKFTLMCGTVANWWPQEIYGLSVKYDCPINYHAYAQALNGARVANDFQDASGLWDVLEKRYGSYPEYVFGETTVYKSSAEGWRAPGCLNGDLDKLVSVCREVQHDTQKTRAYNEKRIIGWGNFGAWFTTGGGTEWALYELEAPQLTKLAQMYAEEARLSPPTGVDVDAKLKADINGHAKSILALTWLDGKTAPFVIPAVNKVVTFYHQDGSPFVPANSVNVTWPMQVTAKSGLMLLVLDKIGVENDWWVKAEDVMPQS